MGNYILIRRQAAPATCRDINGHGKADANEKAFLSRVDNAGNNTHHVSVAI
jgi:hypothetical protein